MADSRKAVVIDDLGDEPMSWQSARYSISSYGADFDVRGLVQRLEDDEILVPEFQRDYVWSLKQASRFVESLLLGLPVPGVFFSKEPKTQKLLVIDGQQRLESLRRFFRGQFVRSGKKPFELVDVAPDFSGKTYNSLNEEDRRRINNSIIHATIVRQEEPDDDQSSIYLIFQRLNSGGNDLQSQEIRSALYHGEFQTLIRNLNLRTEEWRGIFGSPSKRLKDEELILRFLALFFASQAYQRPMENFLNKFMSKNRYLSVISKDEIDRRFVSAVKFAAGHLGATAFRPLKSFNAAIFDSVMVGLARRLERGPVKNPERAIDLYSKLLKSKEFLAATSKSTADEASVEQRLRLATEAFSSLR